MTHTRGWDKGVYAALRKLHAPLWRKLFDESGAPSVAALPGFIESLRSLLEQGYTFTDVAIVYGVSRQRAQQWAKQLDLYDARFDGVTPRRVWDDAKGQFVPVTGTTYRLMRQAVRTAKRRAVVEASRAARRAQDTETLRLLAVDLDRVPTLLELGEEMGFPPAQAAARLAVAWREPGDARPYADALARLYRAAGLEIRAIGGAGHVDVAERRRMAVPA